jgi:hypothetical protein
MCVFVFRILSTEERELLEMENYRKNHQKVKKRRNYQKWSRPSSARSLQLMAKESVIIGTTKMFFQIVSLPPKKNFLSRFAPN